MKTENGGSVVALIAWELRRRRWSTLWWIVGFGTMIALVVLVYPTFHDQAAVLDKSLEGIPESAKRLFTDTSDLFSPVGYLSSQLYYLLAPLLFSCLAIGLGASLLAREESDRTIELLLARPVSRSQLLFAKALAGFVILAVVCAVMIGVAVAGAKLVDFTGVGAGGIALVTLMSAALGLVFGALAFMFTALGKLGRGAAIGISALVGVASYLVSSLDKTVEWLQFPAKLLPFHYYHPAEILGGGFKLSEFLGFIAVVLVLMVIAWLAFRRRDIS